MASKFPSYSYPDAEMEFAQVDMESYERISANLEQTRTLAAVRKGFGIEGDLETV